MVRWFFKPSTISVTIVLRNVVLCVTLFSVVSESSTLHVHAVAVKIRDINKCPITIF